MTEPQRRWALIVHGGAKPIKPEERQPNRDGCLEALAAGQAVLEGGGTAVDAVEASIRVLEALPVFNAGYGSTLNTSGEVEMCAGIMDGATLEVGAVGAIMGVRHPVSVARTMLPEQHVLIAGEGAFMFARERNAELCAPGELITEKAKEEQDTVGAVAIDMNGNLAAGTSTGGLSGQLKGRMGDSALPGGGYYADNHIGACALSGHGEGLARLAAAAQIMGAIDRDGPEAAIAKALSQMSRVGGDAGGIALDRNGRMGWWHNSPDFAVALAASDVSPMVWTNKNEEVGAHGRAA